jgi:hypothetical protein
MSETPDRSTRWWFAWIIATVIIPGGALVFIGLVPEAGDLRSMALRGVGTAAFLAHLIASAELARDGSALKIFILVVGGWFLMAVSLFASCTSLLR